MTTFLVLAALAQTVSATDRLPNMVVWTEKMYDNVTDTTTIPGRKLLRFSSATANLGPGRLELRGGEVEGDKQRVYQRVFRSDGTHYDRLCGNFVYHPSHEHFHFDDWNRYRLRTILPNEGVGPVVVEGQKQSFCVLDLYIYDRDAPGFVFNPFYTQCDNVIQGQTPGWADIYHRQLPDQWIDVTGVPDGLYWLESEVNPDGNIIESRMDDNIGRIQVYIGTPPPGQPDLYEPNNTMQQVINAPEGGLHSPNFGSVTQIKMVDFLSIHDGSDVDFYRFILGRTGTEGDYVRIDSPFNQSGDIDMQLLDANGNVLDVSDDPGNFEQISLLGAPSGAYFVKVYPFSGYLPRYRLTIQPAGNRPPKIEFRRPIGFNWCERGIQTFTVQWSVSDPENDPLRVSLFFDDDFEDSNGGLVPLLGYQNMPGNMGIVVVNTSTLPLGSWYLYGRVSDGGTFTGAYADAKVIIYKKGDIDYDGHVTVKDYGVALAAWRRGWWPPSFNFVFDMNRNGVFDAEDMAILLQRVIRGPL